MEIFSLYVSILFLHNVIYDKANRTSLQKNNANINPKYPIPTDLGDAMISGFIELYQINLLNHIASSIRIASFVL